MTLTSPAVLDVIGKYRIERILGAGGMGRVYLAEDTSLGREVALKVLHASLSLDADFRARFSQEARTVARLNHPHIVRIHAFAEIDGLLVIESEYHCGGSLGELLARRHVPPGEMAAIAHQMLQALHYCHESGILHRDVKPSNILFDQHGRALLADFGVAKLAAEHMGAVMQQGSTTSGFFLGTPRYAPPESWDGEAPTAAGDLYSLGMILYEGVSGAYPYDARSHLALLKQMFQRRATPLREIAPHVSPELSTLVDALIAQEPGRRPKSAAIALEALSQTSEWHGHGQQPTQTILLPHRRDYARTVQAVTVRASRAWRASASWVSLVCVLLMGAVLLYARHGGQLEAEAARPTLAPVVLQQAQAMQEPLSAAALPHLAKQPPENWVVLDTFTHEDGRREPLAWLLLADEDAGRSFLIGSDDHGLLGLEVREEPDSVVLSGGWAEYRGVAGTVFRHGSVSGAGTWSGNGEILTAQLEYTNYLDNSRWSRTITAMHSPRATDTAFLLGFESRPNTLALLHNELLPRKLAWAGRVEAHLPALAAQRLSASRVHEALPPGPLLEDRVWRDGMLGLGAVPGVPHTQGAHLQALHDTHGLHLRITLPAPPAAALLELNLLTHYAAPQSRAAHHRLRYSAGGTAELLRVEPAGTVRITEGWQVRDALQDDTWTIAGFFSYAALGAAEPPAAGARAPWRLNAQVLDLANPAQPALLVGWGYPFPDALEHGLLLEFD